MFDAKPTRSPFVSARVPCHHALVFSYMPFIQLNDNQIPLRLGEMGLGTGATADIRVPGGSEQGVLATVQLFSDHHVAIRRVHPTVAIKVNGVLLGAEPSPLIHGDKINVGGAELQFGDDKKQAGGTQVISGFSLPPNFRKSVASDPKPTSATGGRLVSLVDGREFQIKSTGLTLGRDAACDVVLPGTDISRNHAEISVSADGYYVIDLSTNGVFVNGEKIEGTHTLGRGDVIRVGTEEFRFYADVAKAAAPAASSTPSASAPVAADAGTPAPVAKAPAAASGVKSPSAARGATPGPLEPTAPPTPAYVSSDAERRPSADRPLLATLEVINAGPNKGTKHEIRGPLTHIGRGPHNDVIIDDDSVSDSHAKIQKKVDSWIVADVGSTNGTYVSGKRIATEQALIGAPDVRFGGVKMIFRPAADAMDAGKGTRAIAGLSVDQAKRMSQIATDTAPGSDSPEPRKGVPMAVWIAASAVILVVAYFLMNR